MIKLKGKILFNPADLTKKHKGQASWKKMALIMFEGDVSEYFSWFIEKRYNLKLNRPLRGAHVSFINDSLNDMKQGLMTEHDGICELKWKQLAKKWDGKEIEVVLDPDVRSDGEHWWFIIPQESRDLIHEIRAEVGLGRPFFGLHMSIGYANNKNIAHSKYIVNLATKYGGDYN